MLTDKQRAALEAKAAEAGVDPDRLIAEAEVMSSGESPESGKPGSSTPSGEQPKLFMYLLPFVKVREVRQKWLGLTDSFPGDDEVAAAWAAKQAPTTGGTPEPEE